MRGTKKPFTLLLKNNNKTTVLNYTKNKNIMSTVTLKRIKKSDQLNRTSFLGVKTYFSVDLMEKGNGSRVRILPDDENDTQVVHFSKKLGIPTLELCNPNSEFWRDYTFVMESGIAELDDTDPSTQLAILVLKSNSLVIANEGDKVKKSRAEYVLENSSDVTDKKVAIFQVKAEAFKAYAELSQEDLGNVLLVYGKNPKDLTPAKIKEIVGMELESNPKKFLDILGDKNFEHKVFINDLIQESIIRKSGTNFIYDGEPIAFDGASMIAYVLNPKNANMIIQFKRALNLAKKSVKYEIAE